MKTLRQLNAERRKAFRAALKQLNLVQKLVNQNHRVIKNKIYSHRASTLDASDAQAVIVGAKRVFDAANSYAGAVATDFTVFFQ